MKLKRYIYGIALAAATLTLTACSDFLDKDPENSVPEKSVDYTALENMYMPVSASTPKSAPVPCTGSSCL